LALDSAVGVVPQKWRGEVEHDLNAAVGQDALRHCGRRGGAEQPVTAHVLPERRGGRELAVDHAALMTVGSVIVESSLRRERLKGQRSSSGWTGSFRR
jgi:hypothetical protein